MFNLNYLITQLLINAYLLHNFIIFEKMPRNIFITFDGSPSIKMEESGATYHSKYGAITESTHVYINAGLIPLLHQFETLHIFEMGFGTGINAYLSLLESEKNKQNIYYETIELNPLDVNEIIALNTTINNNYFLTLHKTDWNKTIKITDLFTLKKEKEKLESFSTTQKFHLIYFDAFAPAMQPELWTVEIFEKMFSMLRPNGVLVTYSSQSQARRNMQAAGFTVQKFGGIFGKRDCVIAKRL